MYYPAKQAQLLPDSGSVTVAHEQNVFGAWELAEWAR